MEQGFKKLAEEFEFIDKKPKTAYEAMKELGLSAKLDKLKREIDYEKNPALMKGLTNALKNFADHISESFCECFGKNKNEAVLLLTEAFKSQKSSIFKEVDKQIMAEGHVSALNANEAIKEKDYNKAAALTLQSIFYRNIANPFVGGGTNWVVLKAEKTGTANGISRIGFSTKLPTPLRLRMPPDR